MSPTTISFLPPRLTWFLRRYGIFPRLVNYAERLTQAERVGALHLLLWKHVLVGYKLDNAWFLWRYGIFPRLVNYTTLGLRRRAAQLTSLGYIPYRRRNQALTYTQRVEESRQWNNTIHDQQAQSFLFRKGFWFCKFAYSCQICPCASILPAKVRSSYNQQQ